MKKIFLFLFAVALLATGCAMSSGQAKTISPEEARVIAADFINNNLMQPGSQVSIKEVSEENNMYKVVVNMTNGQEIDSYLSKDGKKFFPQVYDIAEIEQATQENANQANNQPVPAANVPKAEKASVELFVMSHCPYGTQIEKGILPVIKTLGDKVDFELKFCDYAMHGKPELDEQLVQHCIQKEEPEKLITYLECFLGTNSGQADEGTACMKDANINQIKINNCVAAIDQEYEVTTLYNDKSTWKSGRFPQFNVDQADAQKYGITGSPGLVINGTKVQSGRDSATLLTNICAGFENPPAECDTQLTSTAPAPGFGYGGTGSNNASAGCGP